MIRFLPLALLFCAVPASAGLDDYQRAREALERGEVMPLGAILAMMVVLWVTEALPLAVTALIGPVLA